MRPRFGIRARITGGSLLIAVAFSIVAGVILYSQIHRIVQEGSIAVLRADAAPYEQSIATSAQLGTPGPAEYIAVVDPDGSIRINSLPASFSGSIDELLRGPGATHAETINGRTLLVREAEVAGTGGVWHVISARDASSQQDVLDSMTVLLVVAIASIDLALAAASWALTSIALRPVRRMRTSAETLAREGGDEILPAGPPEDEIAELARTLNTLIVRLRSAAERERQIVSDASHELRTPIAIVRTQLEVARAESRSIEQLTTDIVTAEAALARLSRLADDLLELSRIDASQQRGSASVSDLGTAVTDAADRARVRALGTGVQIEYDVLGDGDPSRTVDLAIGDVGRVLDNLVSNALTATAPKGSVELRMIVEAGVVQLLVTDTGGGMEPAFTARALERFSRPIGSRTGRGAGLGLAIVDGLARSAGGSVELRNRPGEGLTVLVALPFSA